MHLLYDDVTDATKGLSWLVLSAGVERNARGFRFKELNNVSWELMTSRPLLPWLSSRKIHVFQLMAETLWVLSGQERIAFLQHYIPSAASFSDDGVTWPGAYGPRLHAAVGMTEELLVNDPETRRAYIPIHYPSDLSRIGSSRDIPCNVGIQFYLTGQYLNLVRFCRSNDLLFGYAINHFEFSVLMAVLAARLSSRLNYEIMPGKHINHVTSLHVYEDKYEQMTAMAADLIGPATAVDYNLAYGMFDRASMGPDSVTHTLVDRLQAAWEATTEEATRQLYMQGYLNGMMSLPENHFLVVFYTLLGVHMFVRKGYYDLAGRWWQTYGYHRENRLHHEVVVAAKNFLLSKDQSLSSIL